MQRSVIVLLSALWLALTPALCAAGALRHPCDPSEATACGDCCEAEEIGCDCIEGCSHDGCENDPCQMSVRPEEDSTVRSVQTTAPLLIVVAWLDYPSETVERPLPSDGSGPPGLGKNLPYFRSDLPLRI